MINNSINFKFNIKDNINLIIRQKSQIKIKGNVIIHKKNNIHTLFLFISIFKTIIISLIRDNSLNFKFNMKDNNNLNIRQKNHNNIQMNVIIHKKIIIRTLFRFISIFKIIIINVIRDTSINFKFNIKDNNNLNIRQKSQNKIKVNLIIQSKTIIRTLFIVISIFKIIRISVIKNNSINSNFNIKDNNNLNICQKSQNKIKVNVIIHRKTIIRMLFLFISIFKIIIIRLIRDISINFIFNMKDNNNLNIRQKSQNKIKVNVIIHRKIIIRTLFLFISIFKIIIIG